MESLSVMSKTYQGLMDDYLRGDVSKRFIMAVAAILRDEMAPRENIKTAEFLASVIYEEIINKRRSQIRISATQELFSFDRGSTGSKEESAPIEVDEFSSSREWKTPPQNKPEIPSLDDLLSEDTVFNPNTQLE